MKNTLKKVAGAVMALALAVGIMSCSLDNIFNNNTNAGGESGTKQTVATPAFSPAAGAVDSGTSVTISCATEGATIHYTTDGSEPTASSSTYSTAISVTAAVTIKAIAVKDGMNNSAVASAAYTINGPEPVQTVATPAFSVAAGAVDSGTTVTISCATEGAVIHYTTDGSEPTASSTTYSKAISVTAAVTIKAIAVKDGMNNSTVASAAYTINGPAYYGDSTGLLEGAGTTASAGIKIGESTYLKTSEVVVVPAGKIAVIDMKYDSSWNTYLTDNVSADWKGVFIKDRKVTLSPFVMGQYEVTQQLYEAVMGSNPSHFTSDKADKEEQGLRPVEKVWHYEAVAFCNELTKKTMSASDVVYFSNEAKTKAYTIADATDGVTPYMDITKKGYRLPTEAEWEYAARGGNPQSAEWKNAFGKVTTKDNAKVYDGSNYLNKDENLATVGWYSNNSSSKTHEVGLKEKNSLNLYDMQGNVWEWCWDWYNSSATSNDSAYTQNDKVVDPVGASDGSKRVCRGGSWYHYAYYCPVSYRIYYSPSLRYNFLGFRLCRSL